MPSKNKKKSKDKCDINSLERVPIKEEEIIRTVPILPLPINKDVNMEAYVDVNQLKSAIAIQFRNELLKASSTILSCLVCENTTNSGMCKVCFRSNDNYTIPVYSTSYNDTINKRKNNNNNNNSNNNNSNNNNSKTNGTIKYDTNTNTTSTRPSFAEQFENRKNKKIPSYYNLPFNKTILSNHKSNNNNSNSNNKLDVFLQQSFREKFDMLNKGTNY